MKPLSLRTLLLILIIPLLLCCKVDEQVTPDNPDDPKTHNDKVWDSYTESEMPLTAELGEVKSMSYVTDTGKKVIINAYPGYVFAQFNNECSVKHAWELIIAAGGEVVAQCPETDSFLVKTVLGGEGRFVKSIKQYLECIFAYPQITVQDNAIYYIDQGNHAEIVRQYLGEAEKKYINCDLYDSTYLGSAKRFADALKNDDCDALNISRGPKHTKDGETYYKYGSDKERDEGLIDSMIEWFNYIGAQIIKNGNTKAPVVVSAGNSYMHSFEEIIGGLNETTSDLLGKQLFIICAEQVDKNGNRLKYSNKLSTGKKSGVITIDISFTSVQGTSIAAPTFVKYISIIVNATKNNDSPFSYAEAARYLNRTWLANSFSAYTDGIIEQLIYQLVPQELYLENVPETVEAADATCSIKINASSKVAGFENGLDVPWVISTDCDWIHFSKTKGKGFTSVKMTVDGYSGDTPRKGKIILQAEKGYSNGQTIEKTIIQSNPIILPAEHEMYYVLPSIDGEARYYYGDWQSDIHAEEIIFKTNFRVSECFLEDNMIEHRFAYYLGNEKDEEGFYTNSITLSIDYPFTKTKNYIVLFNNTGYRPDKPFASRSSKICVVIPGTNNPRKGKVIASVTQVGLPYLEMDRYKISDVEIPYDVYMSGKFQLSFNVTYPDALTKSVCTGLE